MERNQGDRAAAAVTATLTTREKFNMALTKQKTWADKDLFLDIVYWMRQILGLLIGILWGVFPLKGLLGIILFLAINALIVYVYCSSFQQVDEEQFGGLMELLKEGLMTSAATFLVSWIVVYSALHAPHIDQ